MVGKGVSLGRINCGAGFASNEKSGGEVGVKREGWKGVGVAVASGAEVIRTKGRGACSGAGAGAPQAVRIKARRIVRQVRVESLIELRKARSYGALVGNAVGLEVRVGMGVAVGATVEVGCVVGGKVAVNGKAVCVNGSVGYGVTVLPGSGEGIGVRVETFGTHRSSPG